jgi:beta-glucuronidase
MWEPSNPALYELKIALPGGQSTTVHFGFRTWAVSPDGHATLNGKPLSLRGASFHEDVPRRGHALRPGDRDKIVAELKGLGADLARAHYPPHPALLEAFDREGIAYWDQIPVWRMTGGNLRALHDRALDAFQAMVLRDRNHASVMTWSAENETLRGGGAEQTYLTDARQRATDLDGSRPLSVDNTLPLSSIPAFYNSAVDMIGLNEYVGWYGKKISDLPGVLADFRARFPTKAMFVTEFGAEANRGGSTSQKGTFGFQRRFLDQTLSVFDRNADLSGAVVWALRDFPVRPDWDGGNPKPTPPYLFKGIYNKSGRKKPAFGVVKKHFDAVPTTR